ncbi:MAG: hypothetical protein NUW07_09380 [Candidatus Saccharicenans sp.]|jgi:hypothetical protein|nr:hypothetical protein [Candidatus Saccharicenans sp.]MDH7493655.1 hypothetical protein [Candidatus Saccharicenans sp.]
MKKSDLVRLVAVHMGLGHIRAAYPLRNLSEKGIIIWGSGAYAAPGEKKYWRAIRKIYYFLSRVGSYPLLGRLALKIIIAIQKIPPSYPRQDFSRPNLAVRFLQFLIKKAGLCRTLPEHLGPSELPVINTFYATAVALELLAEDRVPARDNYLLICDADINRVWVPARPGESRLKYLVPCTQVKKRLLSYGVKEENIFLTGFPLPLENIGTEASLEILKLDLLARLLRLDPSRKFFAYHSHSVSHLLGVRRIPESQEDRLTVMFAIGGAGAQTEILRRILKSLKKDITGGKIRLLVSCGLQRRAMEKSLKFINQQGLENEVGRQIYLIFSQNVFDYLEQFNRWLRQTDVLWTKPSELSFYCALGLPIIMAEPIGPQEELNKRWLMEIHAGLLPPGPPDYCREWLHDLRENGRLAEAAWDGFLKARKLGTYKIRKLLTSGDYSEDPSPLKQ